MITPEKLAELREAYKSHFLLQPPPVIKAVWEAFPEIADTLEALWKENADLIMVRSSLQKEVEGLEGNCKRWAERIPRSEI